MGDFIKFTPGRFTELMTSTEIMLLASHDGQIEFLAKPDNYSSTATAVAYFSSLFASEDVEMIIGALENSLEKTEPTYLEAKNSDTGAWWSIRLQRIASQKTLAIVTPPSVTATSATAVTSTTGVSEHENHVLQGERLKALGLMASGIVHDFNNLMTTIISFTGFVSEQLETEHPCKSDLDEILKAAQTASRLATQLLLFAKQRHVKPRVIDVNEVLRDLHKMLRRTVGEQTEMIMLLQDEPFPVLIDIAQLDQILFNIVVNARDAMPEGGTLTIETTCRSLAQEDASKKWVCIEISDTGCGIETNKIEQVFQPFFSSKGDQGTGLGLATCHSLVSSAGGTISIQSKPNQGTRVIICLPWSAEPVGRLARASSQPMEPINVTGRVMIVEDQQAIRRSISRPLKRIGMEVMEARSAQEAMALVDAGAKIDLLITDIMLPGLSGVALSEQVRRVDIAVPVLFISGYVGAEDAAEMAAKENTSFLPKPFSTAELLASVDQLMHPATT